jgi:hypothetical protein
MFTPLLTLFLLIAGHAWADYASQSEYVAFGKNRNMPQGKDHWPFILSAHSLIHGAVVGVLTQSVGLALAETVAHGLIDFAKCEGKIGYKTDQFLHYGAKLVWFAIWLIWLRG